MLPAHVGSKQDVSLDEDTGSLNLNLSIRTLQVELGKYIFRLPMS